MSIQRLGDYIEQYSHKNKNDDPYPVYSVTNSEGFCTEYFNKDVSGKKKTNYKIVPKGYFAYNPSRINVGSIDWQNSEDNVIVSPIYVVFKCLKELDQDYLKYFIKSPEGIRMINSKVSGAVRNNLRFEDLSEFEFNIVEYDKQIEVVNMLKLIEKAIDNEKNQLKLYDELIKARFVELFGDPVENPKGWTTKSLKELVTDDCTISYGIVQTGDDQEDGVPVFRPVDIVNHVPLRSELKRTTEEISNKYKRTILKGREMLITVRANIADTCVVGEEFAGCNVGRGIVPIRTKEDEITLEFLKHQIDSKHLNDSIKALAKGITLIQLNMEDLREIKLIVPPIDEQIVYVDFVKQVDKSKVVVQERIKVYEELLNKKMYEYYIV